MRPLRRFTPPSRPVRSGGPARPAPLARALLALAGLATALVDGFLQSYRRRSGSRTSEAGDVPGWVMVTLMSALLVAGLFIVAGPELEKLFRAAISKVSGM